MAAFWYLVALTLLGSQVIAQCNRGGFLSCDDKKVYLNEHNKYRDQVAGGQVSGQPRAADMIELIWDDAIAKTAQSWANRCDFSHDPNLRLPNGDPMGQNLYIFKTTGTCSAGSTARTAVKAWFDEVKLYKFGSPFSPATGHYTQTILQFYTASNHGRKFTKKLIALLKLSNQLIWADTTRLGCGFSQYKDGQWNACLVVCNYAPPGNYKGELPYQVGTKNCNNIRAFNSPNFSGLCALSQNTPIVC